MKIAVIGTGYVGLISGACLAHKGHSVFCVDKCSEVVEKINAKESPIYEKGLEEILQANAGQRLKATSSLRDALKEAEVVIVAVGTPCVNDSIDLKAVEIASKEIGRYLRVVEHYIVIAVKSTVLPTTTENFITPILEKASGKKAGTDFGICMNPEFLREGSAVEDFLNPDRIVIGGIDARSCAVVQDMYSVFDAPVITTNPRTAEMIKYTSNSLLATMISFSNEIANICSEVRDIDVEEVMEGVHLDHRLNPQVNGKRVEPGLLSYIKAGCGFGGSCFPKDVKALISFSKKKNHDPAILQSVMSVNEQQPIKVVQLLKKVYPKLRGLTIAVLGLSFKPDTDDVRESPVIPILYALIKEGTKLKIYDPVVKTKTIELMSGAVQAPSWREALDGADAAVVVTKWKEFEDITEDDLLKHMKQPVLVDPRRMFKKENFTRVEYFGIGYTNHSEEKPETARKEFIYEPRRYR